MSEQTPPRLDIDWLKTFAGALAAVTSAVLLSTLGAAGTLIGAAVGSIAATVGTALYNQGLARGRARVAQVARMSDTERVRVGSSPAPIAGDLAVAEETAREEAAPGWSERVGVLPWRRIAAVAAGTFVAVVAVISLFELASGRAVSTLTGGSDGSGGTTIGRVTGSSDPDTQRDPDRDQQRPGDGTAPGQDPAPGGEPTQEPTGQPSTDPSGLPSQEPGTPTPTPTPSEEPSEEPSAPATPTAPATPEPTTPPVVDPAPSATPGATPSA